MAALQAKAAGFSGLYLSGAAMTASMGLPDLGIITVDEVAFHSPDRSRRRAAVAGGWRYRLWRGACNVMHMVRTFEEAGAAAVHIEDQLPAPKKCGHLNDKKLADAHDMAAKVAAALPRRGGIWSWLPGPMPLPAKASTGRWPGRSSIWRPAPTRIFPEALNTAEMFRAFAERMPGVPLLANMTEFGKTPFFTASEFEAPWAMPW